jgi:chemotaxis protein methyltransferase CheR
MIDKKDYFKQVLSLGDFSKISSYIETTYGIQLPNNKLNMVQTRLIKRLAEIEKPTFKDYIEYVFSTSGKNELQNMVDEITTNRTEFFREIQHFDFLKENFSDKKDKVKIWSAGCASGEEPYSIAMLLHHHNIDCEIYACDVSVKALNEARNGEYQEREVSPVPEAMRTKYFTKVQDGYKVNENIKKLIKFYHINLLDNTYNIPNDIDIIFFRNVSIYFSSANQDATFIKMASYLKKDGYLIIGVSENMFNKDLPFKKLKFSIFQKSE